MRVYLFVEVMNAFLWGFLFLCRFVDHCFFFFVIIFRSGLPVRVTNLSDKTVKTDPLELFTYLNEVGWGFDLRSGEERGHWMTRGERECVREREREREQERERECVCVCVREREWVSEWVSQWESGEGGEGGGGWKRLSAFFRMQL